MLKQPHEVCRGCSKSFKQLDKHLTWAPSCKAAYAAERQDRSAQTAVYLSTVRDVRDDVSEMLGSKNVSGTVVDELKSDSKACDGAVNNVAEELQSSGHAGPAGLDVAAPVRSRQPGDKCRGCGKSFEHLDKHLKWFSSCMMAYATERQDMSAPVDLTSETARREVYLSTVQDDVTQMLGNLRYGKNVSGTVVDELKMGIMKLCDSAVKDVAKELQSSDLSGPVGLKVAELFRSRLNWFEGLQTKKQEISSLKKILGGAWVEPVQRLLGSRNVTSEGLKGEEHSVRTEKDYCWDIPLVEQIRALIQQNQVAWKDILESSKRWSSTEPRPPPVTIADIPDGKLFCDHPKLGLCSGPIKCSSSSDGQAIKLAFKMYFDEVEIANPIGFAAGVHSICCFYVSLINLEPEKRNRLENTFVVTLALNTDLKRYGPLKIIAGALERTPNTKPLPDPLMDTSLGGQMRLLDAGVQMEVPCESALGGYEKRTVHGWIVVCCADYPAAAKMLPNATSASALLPCRQCDWQRKHEKAFAPSSFVRSSPSTLRCWKLRTTDQVCKKVKQPRS